MAETKLIMPQLGESIFEGTLTKWLKQPGDTVKRDEPIFEISTDKIDTEIPSPVAGILQRILIQEGQTVEINTVVGIIGDSAAAESPAAGAPAADTAKPEKPKTQTAPPAEAVEEPSAGDVGNAENAEGAPGHVSPLVRRLAKEHGINLALLAGKGTGINGRITKGDILNYVGDKGAATTPPAAAQPGSGIERVPMTAMRKSIAEHMITSIRTSAHVATFFEVDCSSIMKARETLKPEFERAGTSLTITPFFALAVVRALKKFPIVNASVDGDAIVYKKAINVGIAVSIEGGLIVPVIKNAGDMDLQNLAKTINDLGERARTKKLSPDDVKDGTFTITNPGQYGAVVGIPIINQPQVAILCMGGIKKRAVVVDDTVVARPMIMLSLSFDHRIIDGALADQFMADIQKQLETWQG
jgi:2-oxoglutarate dehydrogenase E2 component (dihydrolipoamide succinyltransferase)